MLTCSFLKVKEVLNAFDDEKLLRIERKRVILSTPDALEEIGSAVFRTYAQS
ncbi:MAG: hypothetical protein ACOC36_05840 [Fibrobacterota bacterium]